MKNICASCEKQFKNTERNYSIHGNYCFKCHSGASVGGKNFVYNYKTFQYNKKWWLDFRNNRDTGEKVAI